MSPPLRNRISTSASGYFSFIVIRMMQPVYINQCPSPEMMSSFPSVQFADGIESGLTEEDVDSAIANDRHGSFVTVNQS